MLELRFPPEHSADETHLANVRRVIANALDVQAHQGNRAANQTIIDEIGVSVRLERDESYCKEAIDYHLGILYAHIGEFEKAVYHFERSQTHPGSGGNQLFSDHQHDSSELRRRQELAMQRGIPSFVIASMPRSASASLTQTIASALDLPIMRVSSGRFPNFYLVPRWLNSFSRGGAVLHDHFGALPFNLRTLREGGVREVFVRVRDPRAAATSAARLSNRKYGISNDTDFENKVIQLCESSFIPWIVDWLAATQAPDTGLYIHWLLQPSNAVSEMMQCILKELAPENPSLEQYLRADVAEITANFDVGQEEFWRKAISGSAQERLWNATPQNVKDLLELRP